MLRIAAKPVNKLARVEHVATRSGKIIVNYPLPFFLWKSTHFASFLFALTASPELARPLHASTATPRLATPVPT
jgi:hypothetical protein